MKILQLSILLPILFTIMHCTYVDPFSGFENDDFQNIPVIYPENAETILPDSGVMGMTLEPNEFRWVQFYAESLKKYHFVIDNEQSYGSQFLLMNSKLSIIKRSSTHPTIFDWQCSSSGMYLMYFKNSYNRDNDVAIYLSTVE